MPMAPASLETTSIRIGEMVVRSLAGDVLLDNLPESEAALDAACGQKPAVLALDLAHVGLFTCDGLNVLLDLRLRAPVQGTPPVGGPSRTVRRVLELTDSAPLFPVVATAEEAARFAKSDPPSVLERMRYYTANGTKELLPPP
ncbi:STAS domain-containing protein [Kitasatospora sp. NBC_01287]|uniref:STAS domain-containing protein n=1 Tax=Kitasatospora sp. NBC_01287 TaxID=2903573 RepID=UPI002258AAF1|nr:STAS domain-containing protein [Kitasatospora sp. NBC_01287]MCX4751035.1 STAS domain-containing protein [Kitasatospora sp. NBC_01287]